jgi:hypothetical protein
MRGELVVFDNISVLLRVAEKRFVCVEAFKNCVRVHATLFVIQLRNSSDRKVNV